MTLLTEEYQLPVQRAYQIVVFSRIAFYPAQQATAPMSAADKNAPVISALQAVMEKYGRWEFWKCFDSLRAFGHARSHKRVDRVSCALDSTQVRRKRKRVPMRAIVPLLALPQLNITWATDFMRDSHYSGRSVWLLNKLDVGKYEAFATEVDWLTA